MSPHWRKILMSLVVALVLLPVLVIMAAQFGAFSGSPPADLGVKDGKLKPPSGTPNSVTSQAGLWPDHPQARRAAIEPLRYTGDGKVALQKVAAIVKAMERTTIVKQEPGYLYAQCTTRLMRYTDDLEFWLDEPAGVIHVRSASRIGHGDRGVNRARVEAIRHRFING
jgi:uncharacterized protein (DUF1499 family)